jgi:chorismate mutase
MTDVRRVRALRGATTVEQGGGPPAEVARAATHELLAELLDRNELTPDDVISALFTVTPDLYSAAPARAAREVGWRAVPMLTATEAPAEHSLSHCIRVMLHVETVRGREALQHVYLHGARTLRPDLVDDAAAGEH